MRLLALQIGPLLAAPRAPAEAPVAEAVPLAEPIASEDGERDADADLMREVCEAITAEVEPDRLFDAALRPVARALPASPVSLYLIDNESGDLRLEGQCEGSAADRPSLTRGRGLTGAVLQTGWLVATDKPDADPRFDPVVDTPRRRRRRTTALCSAAPARQGARRPARVSERRRVGLGAHRRAAGGGLLGGGPLGAPVP